MREEERQLIPAASILAAFLVVWEQALENLWHEFTLQGRIHITLYMAMLYVSAILLTLLRSILLAFQSLQKNSTVKFLVPYELFRLSLIATAIYVFITPLSILREVLMDDLGSAWGIPASDEVFIGVTILTGIYVTILTIKPILIVELKQKIAKLLTKIKNNKIRKQFFLVIIWSVITILYYPIHEFGHWLIANIDGAEVLGFYPFPRFENGLLDASTIVNEFTFSSIYSLIFFLLAGFLITFLPSLLLFIYLYKKESKWCIFALTWVILSPMASMNDFSNIGRVTQNLNLGIILNIGVILTIVILVIWLRKTAKSIFQNLFSAR